MTTARWGWVVGGISASTACSTPSPIARAPTVELRVEAPSQDRAPPGEATTTEPAGPLIVEEHVLPEPPGRSFPTLWADASADYRRTLRSLEAKHEGLRRDRSKAGMREVEKLGVRIDGHDLIRNGKLIRAQVSAEFEPAINASGDDFALVVSDSRGRGLLVRKDSVADWDVADHGRQAPVFVGDDLLALRVTDYADVTTIAVVRGAKVEHSFKLPRSSHNPVKAFLAWQGHWYLEAARDVMVDGESTLNAQGDYAEVFGARILEGKLFFFFTKQGRVGMNYGGEELPMRYDDVLHDHCCESASYDESGNDHMVWFRARRSDFWYYVEAGTFDRSP